MTVKRKLTTIFCADVVGYSRLMGADETGTLKRLKGCREFMADFIAHHHGRVVSWSGDAVLAEFSSVVESLQCAIEVQRELKARNENVAPSERMEFRIGINLGDVMIDEHDIFGEGVNIASRLQGLAPPGGILISGSVYEQVRNKLSAGFNFLGHQQVKNIADQVPAYVVLPDRPVAAADAALAAPAAPPAATFGARLAAGATDLALAGALTLGIVTTLQAAGLSAADLRMPFGLLTTTRVVESEDPQFEISEGVTVTRQAAIENRTFLGVATQTVRVVKTETARSGRKETSTSETLIDPRSKAAIAPLSLWWWVLGAYLGLMFATEGVGSNRRSPGKALMGLSVQGAGGKPLSGPAGVWRNLAKIASAVPLFGGFLLPLWTKKPQALHDLLSGAKVVGKG